MRNHAAQQLLPFEQRDPADVPVVVAEEVEEVERDRDRVVSPEPGGEPVGGRALRPVRRHQHPVGEERFGADPLGLGPEFGQVGQGAAAGRGSEARPVFAALQEDREAFHLRLEQEVAVGERRDGFFRLGRDRRGIAGPGLGFRQREERLPVRFLPGVAVAPLEQEPLVGAALRLDQVPGAAQLSASQPDYQFPVLDAGGAAVAAAFRDLVGPPVPDDHRPAAVLPGGDHPVEVGVGERVVFRSDGQFLDLRVVGEPARHRPGLEDAADLQAQVVVEPSRLVPMHDELPRRRGRFRRAPRRRLGCPVEPPLGAVGVDGLPVGPLPRPDGRVWRFRGGSRSGLGHGGRRPPAPASRSGRGPRQF